MLNHLNIVGELIRYLLRRYCAVEVLRIACNHIHLWTGLVARDSFPSGFTEASILVIGTLSPIATRGTGELAVRPKKPTWTICFEKIMHYSHEVVAVQPYCQFQYGLLGH